MKTALVAVALVAACAIAAQAQTDHTDPQIRQALQPSTTQIHGSIIVHSQVGAADQPTLERWRVTWEVVKRLLGFTDPNLPPPATIYLLTRANFRRTGKQCPETASGCGAGGSRDIFIAGFIDSFPADKFRFESSTVTHELIHMGVEWFLMQDELYFAEDFAHRSPGLAAAVQWAAQIFYDRVGPDLTPGTFDRERYQQMMAVAREMLGEAMVDELHLSVHATYEVMSDYYYGYESLWPGSGEGGVATEIIKRMIGRVDMHYDNTPGYTMYFRVQNYVWHETTRECQARGVVCSN